MAWSATGIKKRLRNFRDTNVDTNPYDDCLLPNTPMRQSQSKQYVQTEKVIHLINNSDFLTC